MVNSLASFIELVLLAFAVALVFERSRRWAVYGDTGKIDTLMVSAVLFCLFISILMFVGHRVQANRLSNPYLAANLPLPQESGGPRMDAKMRAQRDFLATGQTTNYDAGPDRVTYKPTEFDTRARERIAVDVASRIQANDLRLSLAGIWMLGTLGALFAGWRLGRQEYRNLAANHGFARLEGRRTFADVDGLINTLRGACEDANLHRTLDLILTQPDHARKAMLRELITEMRAKQAPNDLIDAFICLMDDAVAEKAYAVIYKCERPAASLVVGAN